jgi:hypothetical protein
MSGGKTSVRGIALQAPIPVPQACLPVTQRRPPPHPRTCEVVGNGGHAGNIDSKGNSARVPGGECRSSGRNGTSPFRAGRAADGVVVELHKAAL